MESADARNLLVLEANRIADGDRAGAPLDAAAVEALVQSEHGRIRGLAWRFGIPAPDLDDAVQEVFLRVLMGWRSFRGASSPNTWLTRVAVNHFTSRRAALKRRLRTFPHHPEAMATAPARPAASAEQVEAHERVMAHVRRLPPKLRQVLVLRCLEELSGPEVAEVLGIPETTVRTRLHHARKKLRTWMEED